MQKIALFGTSADPPTAGHQLILKWLAQRFDLVAVWAADNPFKQQQTPLAHREMMLKLLLAELSPPNICFDASLSDRYTIETVARARQQWPEAEFTLVIGSDLISPDASGGGLSLLRWHRAAELLPQVKLLVVPRPGYPIAAENLQELQRYGAQVAIASTLGLDVSSTAYRQAKDPEVLTPPVEAYIQQQGLYA